MSPDDVLAWLADHSLLVFGTAIAIALIVLWRVGRPRRWFAWLGSGFAVLTIGIAALAMFFFANFSNALTHRVESLSIETRDHAVHRISDYRGKVVVLNYWATWCGPCREEIPALNRVMKAQKSDDVVLLALTDEDFSIVEKFLAKYPIEGTVAKFTAEPPRGRIASMAYAARPTTLILDREGKIQRVLVGARSEKEFEEAIRAAL